MAAVGFLYLSIYFTETALLLHEIFLGMFDHKSDQTAGNWQNHQCDQRHQRTDRQHHNQHADHRRNRGN